MDKPWSCIWDYVSHTPPGLNLGKLDYTIRPVWQPCQTDSRLSFCLHTAAALRHSSTKIHFVWREKAESEEHYLQPRAIAEIKSIFLFYILFLHLLDIWKILPKQTNIRLRFWKLFNAVLKAPVCCHALAINSINSKDKISAEGRSKRVHMQDMGKEFSGVWWSWATAPITSARSQRNKVCFISVHLEFILSHCSGEQWRNCENSTYSLPIHFSVQKDSGGQCKILCNLQYMH